MGTGSRRHNSVSITLSIDRQEVYPSCPGQHLHHNGMADPFPGSDSGHLSQCDAGLRLYVQGPAAFSHRQAWQYYPWETGSPLLPNHAKDPDTKTVGASRHLILPHLTVQGPGTARGHVRIPGPAGLLSLTLPSLARDAQHTLVFLNVFQGCCLRQRPCQKRITPLSEQAAVSGRCFMESRCLRSHQGLSRRHQENFSLQRRGGERVSFSDAWTFMQKEWPGIQGIFFRLQEPMELGCGYVQANTEVEP